MIGNLVSDGRWCLMCSASTTTSPRILSQFCILHNLHWDINRVRRQRYFADAGAGSGEPNYARRVVPLTQRHQSINIFRDIVLGDESLLFILSSKDLIDARGVHSGKKATQILGQMSDEFIQYLMLNYGPRLKFNHWHLTFRWSTGVFRDIILREDCLMLILSCEGPITVERVQAGKNSALIMGQMSAQSIQVVIETCC